MRKSSPVVLLVLAAGFALSACGGPRPGASCGKAGYDCLDSTNAIECRQGVWVQLPCRGPSGCALTSSGVTCDMSANQPGDACGSAEEGLGTCSPSGNAVYECRDGKLVQTRTCSACGVTNGAIVCQP